MQGTNTGAWFPLKLFLVLWNNQLLSKEKGLITENTLQPGHWCTNHHQLSPESWSGLRAPAGVVLIDSFPPERRPVCMSHCWRIRVWPEINWILIQHRAVPTTAIWRYSIQIGWQPTALDSHLTMSSFGNRQRATDAVLSTCFIICDKKINSSI